ncbi:MAG: lysylphosphatidylglycerol synthase domain-containing protein [Acidimicrobiales bacterium]
MAHRQVLVKIARTALAVAAAAVLVWIGRRNASELGRVHVRLRLGWLAASLAPYALASLCLAVGWRTQLRAFGHRLPLTVAIRMWWRAQLARYIPSGLAAFASRAALARQEGVPPAVGAGSLGVELAILIGWGSLAAAIGLPSSLLSTPLRVALGAGAVAALLGAPPLAPRVLRQSAHTVQLAESVAWYGVSVALKSVAFVAFAAALVSVHVRDAWLLAGAVQGASVIGIIGITPAGIGIRETAMVGMLSHRMSTTDAAAVAVAWRAFEFAFELGWLGVGSLVRRTPAQEQA